MSTRLDGKSFDNIQSRIDKLKRLFPEAVKEGRFDPELLVGLLEENDETVGLNEERYDFTWKGKADALRLAQRRSDGTLRPCFEESRDWDTTQNLYIEGDNLEVMKLLQQGYLRSVKMIYIDPPYNTGNDFVYQDDFADPIAKYKEATGQGMRANPETAGRYHSNWLSMMYPRLKIAKTLLRDDGVIFVSIGDEEVNNLRKMCDDVFGEDNFIVQFSRMMKSGGTKGNFFTPNIDYILAYAKHIENVPFFRIQHSQEQIDRFYNKTETEGQRKGEIYGEERLYKASLDVRPNQRYYIECPDGSFVIPPGVNFPKNLREGEKIRPNSEDGVWKWIYERYLSEKKNGNIVFKETDTSALVDSNGKKSKWNIYNKLWLIDQKEKSVVPSNFIADYENRQSAAELKELEIPFDYAKPIKLMKYLLELSRTEDGDLILVHSQF